MNETAVTLDQTVDSAYSEFIRNMFRKHVKEMYLLIKPKINQNWRGNRIPKCVVRILVFLAFT